MTYNIASLSMSVSCTNILLRERGLLRENSGHHLHNRKLNYSTLINTGKYKQRLFLARSGQANRAGGPL